MSGNPIYEEAALLEKVARNDEKAFAALFNRYRDQVYTVALRLSGSEILSEEIVQDVFLKIWLKRETLREIRDFKSYLFIVSRNHIFSALRQLARRQGAIDEFTSLLPLSGNAAEDTLAEKEYREILRRAIDRLPPQQKQVYLYCREQGLKREEAARLMDIAPETVKAHLAKASRFIRAYCLSRLGLFVLLFWQC